MNSISRSEVSYIQSGLLSTPPLRSDGRALHEYRSVSLETGVAPLANGSAHINIGRNPNNNGGGTEVLAAAKLEVENIGAGYEGVEGGRIVCTVSCSPAAYPHLLPSALDDLQQDMATVLHQTLSHRSLHPANLAILPQKKSWLLNLDCVILADSGNAYDALFMAARAALWDCKVPLTRGVQFKAPNAKTSKPEAGEMDVDSVPQSGFDTRSISRAVDFELPDYWDEGKPLDGRDQWPVCVTVNVAAPVHYLDAMLQEEAATPLRLLLVFSFPSGAPPNLHAMRTLGTGELEMDQLRDLITNGGEIRAKALGRVEREVEGRGCAARAKGSRHVFAEVIYVERLCLQLYRSFFKY
ncbi:RNase-PH domain-containing protein [Mycena kentingensis (nom. inval.)]|nr:RNase-PH domain-containing protein [Mycena kentingensis (nom. inval.)]